MTAALALYHKWLADPRKRYPRVENIHASHAQNACQSNLSTGIHLQIPDKEYREESKGQIAACGGDTVDVCNIDNAVEADTMAGNVRCWIGIESDSLPEV